jgi:hypothetical protein
VGEIIATWKEAGEDDAELVESYPELSDNQLRAAIAYYSVYRDERSTTGWRERRTGPLSGLRWSYPTPAADALRLGPSRAATTRF